MPDTMLDGEIVALDENGAPRLRRPPGGAYRNKNRQSDLLRVRSPVRWRRRSTRRCRWSNGRNRLQNLLADGKHGPRIRFVEHFETGGDAVLRSACRISLEGIVSKRARCALPIRPHGCWTKAKCRAGHEVVIGGWSTTGGEFRSLLVGVNRGRAISSMSAGSVPVSAKRRSSNCCPG